jgi:hypothetical protein
MNPEDNQHFITTELSNIYQEISKLKIFEMGIEDGSVYPADYHINELEGFTEDPDLEG